MAPPPLRAEPECYECFRKGLASFIRIAGVEGERAEQMLEESLRRVSPRLAEHPPPIAGAPVYGWLRDVLGSEDIFHREKKAATSAMADRAVALARAFSSAASPLGDALRACTWANLIDVAQGREIPDAGALLELLGQPLAVDETGRFISLLVPGSSALILGDNAGETVLDRLALELFPESVRILYLVRPRPVLNDATSADASLAGLDQVAEIVSTGLDAPTVLIDEVSSGFREVIDSADVILSKGQGNLEGLIGSGQVDLERIFYSFVVKCGVISGLVGEKEGSGVFISGVTLDQRLRPVTGAGRCGREVESCRSTSTTAGSATGSSSSS